MVMPVTITDSVTSRQAWPMCEQAENVTLEMEVTAIVRDKDGKYAESRWGWRILTKSSAELLPLPALTKQVFFLLFFKG
jgi:hypothetical protein